MTKRMFEFVTKCWNPIVHKCPHQCTYCWARRLIATKLKDAPRYADGKSKLIEKELNKRFKKGDFVFVCDMTDLFAEAMPDMWIRKVLETIGKSEATFLILTKNPSRFFYFRSQIPANCILATTIESNRHHPEISHAPPPFDRYMSILTSTYPKKAVIVEPIMDFDEGIFLNWFNTMREKLEFVVVGYDNYHNCLPEPKLAKTQEFIKQLRDWGFTVYEKTIRKSWDE